MPSTGESAGTVSSQARGSCENRSVSRSTSSAARRSVTTYAGTPGASSAQPIGPWARSAA